MKLVINKQELEYSPDYPKDWKISAGDPFKFPVLIGDQYCFIKRFQNKRPENISGWPLLEKLKGKSELSLPRVLDIKQVEEKNNEISYVFYEYLEGATLEQMLSSPEDIDVKRIMYDLFNALEAIHRNGFWFADFCEKNIFCEKSGRYLLIDLDSTQPLTEYPANDMYGSKDYWIPVYRFYKDVLNQPNIKLEDINGMGLNYLQFIFLMLHLKLFKEGKLPKYRLDENFKLLPFSLNKLDQGFQMCFNKILQNGTSVLTPQIASEIKKTIKEHLITNTMNSTPGASRGAIIHEFTASPNVVQKGGTFTLSWNVEADKTDLYRNGSFFQTLGNSQQSLERMEFYDSEKDVTYELVAFKGGIQAKSKPVIIRCASSVPSPTPAPTANPAIAEQLSKIRKWARFVAIIGIIYGAMVTIGFTYSQVNWRGVPSIPGLIVGLLMLFSMIFLLRFANKAKRGLASSNDTILMDSFKNLKYFFTFLGILICTYLLMLLTTRII